MTTRIERPRSGITWVEIVIALGAMFLIVALLLPALSPSHRPAKKSMCQDHLHNLAIAIHNYEGTHRVFAPGWVEQVPHGSNWSWGAQILPYLEQKPLYDHIGVEGPLSLAEALVASSSGGTGWWTAAPDIFACPSAEQGPTNPARLLKDSTGGLHETGIANYVGNFGPDWTALPDGAPRGFFGRNSSIAIANLTDGTSNLVLVGERAWQLPNERTWYGREITPAAQCDAAIAYGVGGNGADTFRHYVLGVGEGGVNVRTSGSDGRSICTQGFSSQHLGGSQFAMGDAKVEFLSSDIDPDVLRRLLDRQDGEPVKVP